MKKIVETDLCPKAVGPYSQSVMVKDFLFTSGQIGIDPAKGEIVAGGIKAQTRQVIENLKNLLSEAGLTLNEVIKSTIFITDMNDFSEINEIYAEYFKESLPARACVEVSKLPKEALIEIEVIAHK